MSLVGMQCARGVEIRWTAAVGACPHAAAPIACRLAPGQMGGSAGLGGGTNRHRGGLIRSRVFGDEEVMKPTIHAAIVLPGLAMVAAPTAQAQQVASSPQAVVKSTIDQVMAAIRADPEARAGNPGRVYGIVRQYFLPSTDFMLTTQYAVGNAWAGATPAQRQALFEQFQTLLARTYALELTQVQGEETRFTYAPAAPPAPGALDAVVRTTVITHGDSMPIGYRMRRTPAGWKIYDIDMMGAWMIQVYRQQFAARLASGGIDGLIRYLAQHNQAP
jgi:ABC-type transporter MlaC component